MKDGRTHLAHKAEHAIDLDSGALVAVTLHDADQGDTTTLAETAVAAAEQVEAAHATTDAPGTLEEIVADKGYHSNATLVDLAAVGISAVSTNALGNVSYDRPQYVQNMRHCLGRHAAHLRPYFIGGGGEPQSADHSLRAFPTIASGAASAATR